jgi:Fe-S-cluster containining protein
MEPGNGKQPDEVEELDRQVERAALFVHASFDRIASRATAIHSELRELIDLLRERKILDEQDLRPPVEGESPAGAEPAPGNPGEQATATAPWPSIALRSDLPQSTPTVAVNCAERMHICHAVCCKLHFALSAPEVDAGTVRFDLGFPYMIRHDSDGYCTHNDRSTGRCGVYADRPGVCRRYSCANDERIWKDFEKMELNQEWIDANVGQQPRIRLRLDLPLMDAGAAPRPDGPEEQQGATS